MGLRDYIRVARRHWRVCLVAIGLALAVATVIIERIAKRLVTFFPAAVTSLRYPSYAPAGPRAEITNFVKRPDKRVTKVATVLFGDLTPWFGGQGDRSVKIVTAIGGNGRTAFTPSPGRSCAAGPRSITA